MVSDIMGRLNNYAFDHGYVGFYLSYYSLEHPHYSVPDPYNTLIKSIYDDEMYQLLELFHLDHDDDLLDDELQML